MYKKTTILLTKNNEDKLPSLDEAFRLVQQQPQNLENIPLTAPVVPSTQNVVITAEIQTQTESARTVDAATQTDPEIFNLRMLANQVRSRLRNSNNNNTQEYRDEIESLLDLLPPPTNLSCTHNENNSAQEIINNIPVQNDITENITNMEIASHKMRNIEKIQQLIVDQMGNLYESKLFWATITYLIGYFTYHITPGVFWREFGKYFMKFFRGIRIRTISDWFKPDKILPNLDFRQLIEKSYKSNDILTATLKALRKIMKKWF